MFSLNSRMRSSSSAFVQLPIERPFSSAVAACAATADSSAMSSLLSGSALALRPSAITAIVPSFETQGRSSGRRRRARTRLSAVERRRAERIVERQVCPRSGAAPMPEPRASSGGASGTRRARSGDEVAGVVASRRQHQRHAIDDQRFGDARTSRSLRRCRSRSLFRSRAKPTSARR